jgi:hypothetical protein
VAAQPLGARLAQDELRFGARGRPRGFPAGLAGVPGRLQGRLAGRKTFPFRPAPRTSVSRATPSLNSGRSSSGGAASRDTRARSSWRGRTSRAQSLREGAPSDGPPPTRRARVHPACGRRATRGGVGPRAPVGEEALDGRAHRVLRRRGRARAGGGCQRGFEVLPG